MVTKFRHFNPKHYRANECWNSFPYTMSQLFNSQMWPNPLKQEWLNSGLWKYISGINLEKQLWEKPTVSIKVNKVEQCID